MTTPALRATIIPVTPLQQNCTLVWCTATLRAAVVDPGGDLPRIRDAIAKAGVTVEKVLLTHGHIDHAGAAAPLARELGVRIEGPERQDAFWLSQLDEVGRAYGVAGENLVPDRWLDDGDTVTVGDLAFDVLHTPGHTAGHVIFSYPPQQVAIVGDVLFKGSIGRTDFPMSDPQALIDSIRFKLWPLGDDTRFLPGHGPTGIFGEERRTNPFVADRILGSA